MCKGERKTRLCAIDFASSPALHLRQALAKSLVVVSWCFNFGMSGFQVRFLMDGVKSDPSEWITARIVGGIKPNAPRRQKWLLVDCDEGRSSTSPAESS